MLSSKYSRTDLAVELFDPDSNQLPKGIRRKLRKSSVCSITEIIVDDMVAGIRIGKSKGRYITIETDRLSAHPQDFAEQSSNISDELSALIPNKERLLVVGLGNKSITPDALGPLSASRIIATRHVTKENVGSEWSCQDVRYRCRQGHQWRLCRWAEPFHRRHISSPRIQCLSAP